MKTNTILWSKTLFLKNLLYANNNNFLQSIFTEKETSPSPVLYVGIIPPSPWFWGKGIAIHQRNMGRRVPQPPLTPQPGTTLRPGLR